MSEESPVYHQVPAPSAEAILASPRTSPWLRDALRAALKRDPVEAARDAQALAAALASLAGASLRQG